MHPQQSVQPQTRKKEKTWLCSPSSRQWLNFISTAGWKSRREISRQECENFAPPSTADAHQSAHSSSASCITLACFTEKKHTSSDIYPLTLQLLRKAARRGINCLQQEKRTATDPHGQGTGPTTMYSTQHHHRLIQTN